MELERNWENVQFNGKFNHNIRSVKKLFSIICVLLGLFFYVVLLPVWNLILDVFELHSGDADPFLSNMMRTCCSTVYLAAYHTVCTQWIFVAQIFIFVSYMNEFICIAGFLQRN